MKKIGIGIVAWNRPHYLTRLLETLKGNDLTETELHLFQDGHICKFTGEELTKEIFINASVEAFSTAFPNGTVHRQEKNVSIAINQYEALSFLSGNYETFIFLEDDVILSPHYIQIMRILDSQFELDPKVASISPSFRPYIADGEMLNKKHEDVAFFSRGHIWAELYWTAKWRKIEKHYVRYYDIVKTRPYRSRETWKVEELFGSTGYKHGMGVTSQDAGKDWATWMTGMNRVRLQANRATGIGQLGFHARPEERQLFDDIDQNIYVSDSELNIKQFRI